MEAYLTERQFELVGVRHTGRFVDYPALIPPAVQQFQAQMGEIPGQTGLEAILYEPMLNGPNDVGTFWVCCGVETQGEPIPPDMERFSQAGRYAGVKGDMRKMGELYTFLDRWIAANGYAQDETDRLMVEVYGRRGSYEVEVLIPLK